jgi:beta-lactamase superfamily II metal-dependent hydrolase
MTVDVSNNPSIIISHIHRDHWYGMTKFTQAFQCDWYIPAQNRGILFQKRCAEIIASGGNINIINSSIVSNLGTIFTHSSSPISAKTAPKGKHETGLSMKLKLHSDTNSDVNILVPGDQVYDYIPSQHLNNIDILVATHHGGTYTKPNAKYNNIPISAGAGTIIYSYGQHNTYGHPSKLSDYQSKGWTTAHNTYSNLDFSLK